MDNSNENVTKKAVEIECEEDYCDLDPSKICDSCGKCIESDKNYKIIKITKIISD